VYGLAYGVILGAFLHLLIQVPALIKYQFTWIPSLGLKDMYVIKVLKLMGPRVISIFFIQMTFLVRDNLASRLQQGAVSALTYGWMIQQVPETLIGTAIGTALLPTLAEMVAAKEPSRFKETIERAIKVLIAITIPIAVVGALGLRPFIEVVFKLPAEQTDLLLWVTRGYLVGLLGQSVLETIVRSFYARQNAIFPMLGSLINLVIYIGLGSFLIQAMGAVGISLTDSIAFTIQPLFLILVLNRQLKSTISVGWIPIKGILAGLAAAAVMLAFPAILQSLTHLPTLAVGIINVVLGLAVSIPFIWKEARLLIKL
jgi:putative peptidoglycan lipid II flippase